LTIVSKPAVALLRDNELVNTTRNTGRKGERRTHSEKYPSTTVASFRRRARSVSALNGSMAYGDGEKPDPKPSVMKPG
jgi:hypothetical protein